MYQHSPFLAFRMHYYISWPFQAPLSFPNNLTSAPLARFGWHFGCARLPRICNRHLSSMVQSFWLKNAYRNTPSSCHMLISFRIPNLHSVLADRWKIVVLTSLCSTLPYFSLYARPCELVFVAIGDLIISVAFAKPKSTLDSGGRLVCGF